MLSQQAERWVCGCGQGGLSRCLMIDGLPRFCCCGLTGRALSRCGDAAAGGLSDD